MKNRFTKILPLVALILLQFAPWTLQVQPHAAGTQGTISAPLAALVDLAGPIAANAGAMATDTMTRANSTTVGGTSGGQTAWTDTWANGQISSNALVGQKTFAVLGDQTLTATCNSGQNQATVSNATGMGVGSVMQIETGTANVEVRQITATAGTLITFNANFSITHASGVTIRRIRNPAVLRPVGEARTDSQQSFRLGPMGGTAWAKRLYLRWIDDADWAGVELIWNGTTTLTTQIAYCNQGTIGFATSGSQNWTCATTDTLVMRFGIKSTNPSVVMVTPTFLSTGGAVPGAANGTLTANITNANSTTVQAAGQQGIGFADTLCPITTWNSYDRTWTDVAVTDSQFQAGLAPYVWVVNGSTNVRTPNVGAYAKWSFTGTDCQMIYDTSGWQASSSSVTILASVDGGPGVYTIAAPGSSTVVIANNLAYGTHTVYWTFIQNILGGTVDLWAGSPPPSSWVITKLQIDANEAMVAPTLNAKKAIIYTDSLGVTPSNSDNGANPDTSRNPWAALSQLMGFEFGNHAYGSVAISVNSGLYNVPPPYTPGDDTNSSWNKNWAGQSMMTGGLYTVQPDYVFIQLGTNDNLHSGTGSVVTSRLSAWITAIRAAAPAAAIYVVEPYGKFFTSSLIAGVAAAADPNTFFVPMPTWASAGLTASGVSLASPADGIHPTLGASVPLAMALGAAMTTATAPPSAPARTHFRFNTGPDAIFRTLKNLRRTY